MRLGNEEKQADVTVIEHEYQTLTWEQSSSADGKSGQLVGRESHTELNHSLPAPEFPPQTSLYFMTLVPLFPHLKSGFPFF